MNVIIIATMICSFMLSIGQIDKTECKTKLEKLGNIYEYNKSWESHKPKILNKEGVVKKLEVASIYNCFNSEAQNSELELSLILITIKDQYSEETKNNDYTRRLRKSNQSAMICEYGLDKEILYFKYDKDQQKDIKIELLNLMNDDTSETLKYSKAYTYKIESGKCNDCPF
jgi:hypothetical protein